MITFSKWLAGALPALPNDAPRRQGGKVKVHPDILSFGGLGQDTVKAEESYGKRLALLMDRYFAQVVNKAILKQPFAVRTRMQTEWAQLKHRSGTRTLNFENKKQDIDDYAKRWTDLLDSELSIETVKRVRGVRCIHIKQGTNDVGPISLRGQTLESDMFVGSGANFKGQTLESVISMAPDIQRVQDLQLYPVSKDDFVNRGLPGTAWTGICLIGSRIGADKSTIFLFPSNPMRSHLTSSHLVNYRLEMAEAGAGAKNDKSAVTPFRMPIITHGATPSHASACVHLVKMLRNPKFREYVGARYFMLPEWGNIDQVPNQDIQAIGIVFGFSMVKADSELGHYWNFTSVSSNTNACALWNIHSETKSKPDAAPNQTSEEPPPVGYYPGPPPPWKDDPVINKGHKGAKVNNKMYKATTVGRLKKLNDGNTCAPREWAQAIVCKTQNLGTNVISVDRRRDRRDLFVPLHR